MKKVLGFLILYCLIWVFCLVSIFIPKISYLGAVIGIHLALLAILVCFLLGFLVAFALSLIKD
jgi:hypothetical protein